MKKTFIAAIGLVVVLASFNGTQDRKFNLSLTEAEIQTVLDGLGKLPLERSQGIYINIVQQAQAQLQPPKPVQKIDSTSKKKN